MRPKTRSPEPQKPRLQCPPLKHSEPRLTTAAQRRAQRGDASEATQYHPINVVEGAFPPGFPGGRQPTVSSYDARDDVGETAYDAVRDAAVARLGRVHRRLEQAAERILPSWMALPAFLRAPFRVAEEAVRDLD
jgi:hypothetical protein